MTGLHVEDLYTMLKSVEKPGRYAGGEINSVVKEHIPGMLRMVLAYPDVYEVGMSYLGIKILYHLLNEKEDILCERVFMPWPDMAVRMKEEDMKLFSLETKTAIDRFDILGFSLSYELTYTNVLAMMDMGGVTVLSSQRGNGEPLVIAGGACSYNPEPMADFIDAFLIGDGEESLLQMADIYKRTASMTDDRKKVLKALSGMGNVYVPSFYRTYFSGYDVTSFEPVEPGVPVSIKKASVRDFENAYYPEKQITPLINIIHDRIAVEIMRGCPNKCRFCQAGVINRPVRLRSKEKIREICRRTYEYTGMERLALLSLSSINYPDLAGLIGQVMDDFKGMGVGISIPSMRIDERFYELPDMISEIRKTSLTFAPESADDTLRKALGKDLDMGVLCRSAEIAFKNGWNRLKLYFMVGFPRAPEEEARMIMDMARDLSKMKKAISSGAPADVKVSVNPFVPKAHTPLQWLGMKNREDLLRIKKELYRFSSKKVSLEFPVIEQSILEATMARGDRRMGQVIHRAWKNGAIMDGWSKYFRYDIWEKAFSEYGFCAHEYASRTIPGDNILPWDHIDTGTAKDTLRKEADKSGFF